MSVGESRGRLDHGHVCFGPCGFIEVNGRTVHLVDTGTGPGIVMVHGAQAWAYAWRHQIEPLTGYGCRVVAPDLPGCGYSAPLPDRSGIPEISAFLVDLLDRLSLTQAVFVASSAGGLPVLDLAIRHPERVTGLVLVSSCGVPHRQPPLWRLIRPPFIGESARLLLSPSLVRANLHDAFFDRGLVTEEMVDAYLRPLLRPGIWSAQLRLERESRPAFVQSNLGAIRCPVLIVWGENDSWHPMAMAAEFGRRLADAKIVRLPQCGHLPHEEKPQEFNEILTDWRRQATLGRGGNR